MTKALLAPYLEGGSLNEALEANRIFIVDYNILDNLEITDEKRKVKRSIQIRKYGFEGKTIVGEKSP